MALPYTVTDLAVGNALPESWVDAVRLNLLALDERTSLDYVQATAVQTVPEHTIESTAVTVLTGTSRVWTAGNRVIEVYIPQFRTSRMVGSDNGTITLVLLRGATVLGWGQLTAYYNAWSSPGIMVHRDVGAGAGTYSYVLKAFMTGGVSDGGINPGRIEAGPGGSGNLGPAFMRVRADV